MSWLQSRICWFVVFSFVAMLFCYYMCHCKITLWGTVLSALLAFLPPLLSRHESTNGGSGGIQARRTQQCKKQLGQRNLECQWRMIWTSWGQLEKPPVNNISWLNCQLFVKESAAAANHLESKMGAGEPTSGRALEKNATPVHTASAGGAFRAAGVSGGSCSRWPSNTHEAYCRSNSPSTQSSKEFCNSRTGKFVEVSWVERA